MEFSKKMTALLFLSLVCLRSCFATSDPPSLAIVRPFSPSDVDLLPGSFKAWEDFPPCKAGTSAQFDLVLVFSRTLEADSQAQVAIRAVENIIRDGDEWNSCISQVFGLGVDVDPAEDLYDLNLQSKSPLWVNGPNRQFERSYRAIKDFGYDLMYYMEIDNVPLKPFWLDSLMNEIQGPDSDFAILGSKYHGYKWESFKELLPWSLANHINGNAFYNLSHPVLHAIVEQLENEANTHANSMPYDYRIYQIVDEVQHSTLPLFFTSEDETHTLPESLISFLSDYDLEREIRETPLLGNYAATNMLPSFVHNENVVMHGARMFEPWVNTENGNISLVISDWIPEAAHFMLQSLESVTHPFSEAVVVNDEYDYELIDASIPVSFSARAGSSSQDLCYAAVSTPWFVLSNSFFQLNDVNVMSRQGKPVASYQEATYDSCFSYPTCNEEMELARELVPDFGEIYQDFDFVYHTATRDDFCEYIKNKPDWSDKPSATLYVAYLKKFGLLDQLYVTSDRTKYGERPMFSSREESAWDFIRPARKDYDRKLQALKCPKINGPYKCVRGVLVCQKNTCSGVCTDLGKDPNNCGRCGNVCPAGRRKCKGGACKK